MARTSSGAGLSALLINMWWSDGIRKRSDAICNAGCKRSAVISVGLHPRSTGCRLVVCTCLFILPRLAANIQNPRRLSRSQPRGVIATSGLLHGLPPARPPARPARPARPATGHVLPGDTGVGPRASTRVATRGFQLTTRCARFVWSTQKANNLEAFMSNEDLLV